MILTRKAKTFIELKAEELEVTIHDCDQKEIENMILKLEYVVSDLQDYLKSEDE